MEAVEESHNAFTDQHRVSILALDNLCFLRLQQGQGEEALGIARHAHKAWIQLYGPYVPTSLAHRLSLNIAQALRLQGNMVEARSELNKIIVQGAGNKITRSTQYLARVTLARLDLQEGQLQAALDGLQQAMGNIEQLNELKHWTRTRRGTTRLIYLQSLLLRGQIQTALQKTDTAEADLVQSYRGFEKMFGEGHRSTGEALDLLKQLYRETRQFEKLGQLE
jgi:tetratricopeptide (TPR) repeat protein